MVKTLLILLTWTLLQNVGVCDTTDTCVRPIDNSKSIRSLESKIDQLQAALDKQNTDLTSKVTTQQRELTTLKGRVGPKVAFSASLADRNSVSLEPNAAPRNIVFKNVFINNGNAYNRYTGYFTAPHKGAYQFTFSTQSYKSYSGAKLMKNGELQVSTWEREGDAGTVSGAVILSLNAGDTVNVITWGNGYQVYDNRFHHTTFSGFLLFPL